MDNNLNNKNNELENQSIETQRTELGEAPAVEAETTTAEAPISEAEATAKGPELSPLEEYIAKESRLHALAREARSQFSRLGFSYLAYMFAIEFGASFLFVFATLLAPMVNEDILSTIVFVGFMYAVAAPLLFLLGSKVTKRVPLEKKPLSIGDLAIAFFVCVALMIIGGMISNVIAIIIEAFLGFPLVNTVESMLSGPGLWINCIYAGFIAPIGEELVWRKFFIDRTHRYGVTMSIVVSALCFALMHASVDQFVYAFGVGIFFGFLYIKTGRIWITIVLHSAVNLVCGVIPSILFSGIDYEKIENIEYYQENLGLILGSSVYSLLLYAAAFLGVVFFFVFKNRFKLEKREDELPLSRQISPSVLNAGVICFALAMLALLALNILSMALNYYLA